MAPIRQFPRQQPAMHQCTIDVGTGYELEDFQGRIPTDRDSDVMTSIGEARYLFWGVRVNSDVVIGSRDWLAIIGVNRRIPYRKLAGSHAGPDREAADAGKPAR